MNDHLTREELIEMLRARNVDISKFSPKLTYPERCEILALRHAGVRREVLAKMYGVDRRTITHIYNPLSPHYKNVREEETRIGRERFLDRYVNRDLINKAMSSSVKEEVNNPMAKGKAGIHTVCGPMCNYDHRMVIEWRTPENTRGIHEAGWCYRDLDSDSPDDWFIPAGENTTRTSQACYSAALNELVDRLE